LVFTVDCGPWTAVCLSWNFGHLDLFRNWDSVLWIYLTLNLTPLVYPPSYLISFKIRSATFSPESSMPPNTGPIR
jgi:hypothetical protein